MIAVYVAHQYGGKPENREAAKRWVRWLAELGYAPICTWIVLTEMWDESHRDDGLTIDCELISRSDVVLLCGHDVSSGMQVERDYADGCGVPVVDVTDLDGSREALEVVRRINRAVMP